MALRSFATVLSLSVATMSCSTEHLASAPPSPVQPRRDADFRRDPPEVIDTLMTPLSQPAADGNAEVVIRFAPDPRLAGEISADFGGPHPTLLRRQPADPTLYSAIVRLDIEAINARRAALRAALARGQALSFLDALPPPGRAIRESDLEPLRPGVTSTIRRIGLSDSVDWERSLFVTMQSVVEDGDRTLNPCAPPSPRPERLPIWSFGSLVQRMVEGQQPPVDAADFVYDWLLLFERTQEDVSGEQVLGRPGIRDLLITPWENASGGATHARDLWRFPLRLLAIVNRADLHENPVFGGRGAEARFVFGAVRGVDGPSCVEMDFTVIVEFAVDVQGCGALQDWARRWTALADVGLDDAEYRKRLADLTLDFAKPRASVVIRTSERVFGPDQAWEMREFQLSGGRLRQMPVAQTPRSALNTPGKAGILSDYINRDVDKILGKRHRVPPELLGGVARMTSEGFHFDSGGIQNPEARRLFSLATCSGCHAAETNTIFTHMNPRARPWMGASGFLSQKWSAPDPALILPPKDFDERGDRGATLDALAAGHCTEQVDRRPPPRPH